MHHHLWATWSRIVKNYMMDMSYICDWEVFTNGFFKDKFILHFPIQLIVQAPCMTKRNKNDTFFLVGEGPGWTEHVLSFVLLDSIFCHGFCVGIVLRHVCGDQFRKNGNIFLITKRHDGGAGQTMIGLKMVHYFFVVERI